MMPQYLSDDFTCEPRDGRLDSLPRARESALRTRKNKKCRGAIATNSGLKGSGLHCGNGGSQAVLDIFKPEQLVERRDKAGALSASEAERRSALLWPAGYVGGRVNVTSRLSVQATPLLKPPPLPLPWELGTDKPRNWLEIVKHTSKCIGHACGHPRSN